MPSIHPWYFTCKLANGCMDPLQLFLDEYVLHESSNLIICNTLGGGGGQSEEEGGWWRVSWAEEEDDEFVCIDENNINESIHSSYNVKIRYFRWITFLCVPTLSQSVFASLYSTHQFHSVRSVLWPSQVGNKLCQNHQNKTNQDFGAINRIHSPVCALLIPPPPTHQSDNPFIPCIDCFVVKAFFF